MDGACRRARAGHSGLSRILQGSFRILTRRSRGLVTRMPSVRAMNRTHAAIVALLLGVASVFGMVATLRSTHLGAQSRKAEQARLLSRERQLAQAERRLRHALVTSALPVARRRPLAPRTVYVRPAPIVLHTHRAGGEHGDGREGGGDD